MRRVPHGRGLLIGVAVLIVVLPAAAGWRLLGDETGPHLGTAGDRGPGSAAVDPRRADPGPSALGSIAGGWVFRSITGVPPSQLPRGALRDNRHDLVIHDDGTFRWGGWSGSVQTAGGSVTLVVQEPGRLRRRFEAWNAGIGIDVDGSEIRIWLPDLGRDRDQDRGEAQEDIDSPDMLFRRAAPRERLAALEAMWLRASARITYRSTEHMAGEATSPHQCLRQVAGGVVDRATAVRMCLREGSVRLIWDGRNGWRIDDSSAEILPAALSLLVAHPSRVLRDIGGERPAALTSEPGRTIAGHPTGCFLALGTARRSVTWCFSDEGILLSLQVNDGKGVSTTLEATRVGSVADRRSAAPSG